MVDFSNRKEAERWFEDQPREVCIAMAARLALRVFPLCRSYILEDPPTRSDAFVLPLLRAMVPPLIAGTWPTRGGEVRSASARAAAAAAAADAARASAA
ncbi:hypothetical protein, partial [Nisaea nitritireducens]|uniref:hypothetical protein n=1 Tax=Nisaea nitritireducens TaxID=568392 RepID=UPI001D022F8E